MTLSSKWKGLFLCLETACPYLEELFKKPRKGVTLFPCGTKINTIPKKPPKGGILQCIGIDKGKYRGKIKSPYRAYKGAYIRGSYIGGII